MMRTTQFEIKQDHITYIVEFREGRPMRFTRRGKDFPQVTQCLIFCNGEFHCSSEVVKCECDEHNEKFARALALKKLFLKKRYWKSLRCLIWNIVGHP